MTSIRITATSAKVVYLVAAVVLITLVSLAANALFGGTGAGAIATSLLWIVIILLGTRWFRGREEPVAPPRVWWRMTAEPPAGYVLGVLFLLNAATQVFTFASNDPATIAAVGALWPTLTVLVCHGLIGLAYLHSSIRLSRANAATPGV